jgi:hypothetical protein
MYGPLGIVFVGMGITEVDQESISEGLGDISLEGSDRLGTGGLVGLNHLSEFFGIELFGKGCRSHQVTKHHCELATLGFGFSSLGRYGSSIHGLVFLLGYLPICLGRIGDWSLSGERCATLTTESKPSRVLKATS